MDQEKNKEEIDKLYNWYNATSTDDGKGEIETYQNWLERQLLSRINKEEKPMITLEEAFEFSEWCSENMYTHVVNGSWERVVEPNKFKTTSELWQLFQQS